MTEHFLNEIMKTAVSVLCQNIGWNSAQTTAIDILADIWKRQFLQIGKAATRYAEHCGRTQVTLEDAMLAFNDMGINISELEEYIHNFDPVPLPYKVPNFPYPKESHLNCLRPGSAEVLTRPMHIHEYMPPWSTPTAEERKESSSARSSESIDVNETPPLQSHSQEQEVGEGGEDTEKENLDSNGTEGDKDKVKIGDSSKTSDAPGSPPPGSSGSNSFSTPPKSGKRMESQSESPALKRVRMMLEEEGHPLRQISSVMMTSSGFLTSSREGRLPDSRPPPNRDFFEAPPVVPVEKKKKIPTMKKIVEGVKRIEREKGKDIEEDAFDLFGKPDKIITLPPREDGEKVREKDSSNKRDSSRRDKEFARKESSSRRDKQSSKKDKNNLQSKSTHKIGDRKYPKLPEGELKEKLNIFKKNLKLKNSDKLAKKARRLKIKREHEMEELDAISSDDNFGDEDFYDIKPDIDNVSSKKRRRSRESPEQRLTIKKLKTKEKSKSPYLIPVPKSSPKIRDIPIDVHAGASNAHGLPAELLPKKKRGRPRKTVPGMPQTPTLTLATSPLKMARISKSMHRKFGRGLKSLIPEISITKPPPPPLDFNMMIGRLPMQPGLIPTNFASPPPLRRAPNIPPSINITPATPTITITSSPMNFKDGRSSQSLPLPSNVCSSVTITRIDMSNSQKLPTPYDNTSTPGIGPQMSISITPQVQKSSSSNLTIQADANSGITITPIVMDKGNQKAGVEVGLPSPEKEKVAKVSVLAKLDEDIRTKEQRKKDREKRKELKKEKKKERKEKERVKSEKSEKVDKKDRKDKEKKKKPEGIAPEGLVPKITLKLHSNANTPADSPNPPRVVDDRTDTPPPTRKITIKPVQGEEFVKKRSNSPELARFSPLVTRPPKSNKVSPPIKSPPISHSTASSKNEVVSFPPSAPGSKRGPGRPPKSGRGPGRPPKSSQAGLVTETVGYYIDDQGTKVWICPTCGRQDDGSPMIGCDTCDDWYHFTCVGIKSTPDETESWFCKRCISISSSTKKKSSSGSSEHRKKIPKL